MENDYGHIEINNLYDEMKLSEAIKLFKNKSLEELVYLNKENI